MKPDFALPAPPGAGALFGPSCPDCERRSALVPGADQGPDVQRWRQRGAAFVEAEIDAAWQTLERGVPVSNRYGTIDLCTDGLAYARAHRPVLADPVFASWVERFCSVERGWHGRPRRSDRPDSRCGGGDVGRGRRRAARCPRRHLGCAGRGRRLLALQA